jgi:hypothetical protein
MRIHPIGPIPTGRPIRDQLAKAKGRGARADHFGLTGRRHRKAPNDDVLDIIFNLCTIYSREAPRYAYPLYGAGSVFLQLIDRAPAEPRRVTWL